MLFVGTYLGVAGTDVRVYLCKLWNELKVMTDHTAMATGVRYATKSFLEIRDKCFLREYKFYKIGGKRKVKSATLGRIRMSKILDPDPN